MAANQISTSNLNRGLLSNFWWLRSANHVKFTEECVMRILELSCIAVKDFLFFVI